MNKTELINKVKSNEKSHLSVLPKTRIKEILEAIFNTISDNVAMHKSVEIGKLGVIEYDYKIVKGRLEPIIRLRSNNEVKQSLNSDTLIEPFEICTDTKKIFFDSTHIEAILVGSYGKDVKQKDNTFMKNGVIKVTKMPLIPNFYICPIQNLTEFIESGYKLKKLRKVAVKKEYETFYIPTFTKVIDNIEYVFVDVENAEGMFRLGEIFI